MNLGEELGNVSKACKIMRYSQDTFCRYQEAMDKDGVEALFEKNRRKPNLKNRVDEATEQAVVDFAFEEPAVGVIKSRDELRTNGVFISPFGVRSVWARHDLEVV